MMFKEWEKFDHPQFGEVEIGGWRTFTTRIPPLFMLPEMLHRNASLVIFIATHTPEVTLEAVAVEELGENLHRIRVRASNPKALPTLSGRALSRELVRTDILKLEGAGLHVVSGGIVEDGRLDRIRAIEHRPWMIFTSVPSFGMREVQWIVSGSGKATITFDSMKARNRTISLDL
jgi:hypothetical protein